MNPLWDRCSTSGTYAICLVTYKRRFSCFKMDRWFSRCVTNWLMKLIFYHYSLALKNLFPLIFHLPKIQNNVCTKQNKREYRDFMICEVILFLYLGKQTIPWRIFFWKIETSNFVLPSAEVTCICQKLFSTLHQIWNNNIEMTCNNTLD